LLDQTSIIVILFSVKVPVLSEQIQSALPMVSQLLIFFTKQLFSELPIILTDYASAIVTASGRPSGIAHTTTDIPIIKALTNLPYTSVQSLFANPF